MFGTLWPAGQRARSIFARLQSSLLGVRQPLTEILEQRRLFSGEVLIDFETDGLGNATVAGQVIDNEYANLGITVTTNNPEHPATIFDSTYPTGGDFDLGSPNEDFGGAGIGDAGGSGMPGENSQSQGKILILQETIGGEPDDNNVGGRIVFNFATAVDIVDVSVLDIDQNPARVRLYNASGTEINETLFQQYGNNSFEKLTLNVAGVRRMEVASGGSLGLASFTYRPPSPPPPPPPSGTLRWLQHNNVASLQGGCTYLVTKTHTFDPGSGTFVDTPDVQTAVADNTVIDTDSTAGEMQLAGLVLGRYKIVQTSAPSGYAADPDVETIELTVANHSNADATSGDVVPIFTSSIVTALAKVVTNNSIMDYINGKAVDLTSVAYQVKDGEISNVQTGVFSYFSTIKASGSNFTIEVRESVNQLGAEFFDAHQLEKEVRLYDAAGNVTSGLATVSFPADGVVRIVVSGATTGAKYYIGIKYDSKTLVGADAPNPGLHYDFGTYVDDILVDRDLDGLTLVQK